MPESGCSPTLMCRQFSVCGRKRKEEIRLIDWEYAGMQDPHVDIAMFCIYSLQKEQVDHLIDLYFEGSCDDKHASNLLLYRSLRSAWSNWCEYKRKLGVEFENIPCGSTVTQKIITKLSSRNWSSEGKEHALK